MGKAHMLRQLMKIEKACRKNKELEKELETFVPINKKQSDLTVGDIHNLVNNYNKIASKYGVKKI